MKIQQVLCRLFNGPIRKIKWHLGEVADFNKLNTPPLSLLPSMYVPLSSQCLEMILILAAILVCNIINCDMLMLILSSEVDA